MLFKASNSLTKSCLEGSVSPSVLNNCEMTLLKSVRDNFSFFGVVRKNT